MAPSSQAALSPRVADAEVISAATAVFGLLDVISETPSSPSTERNIELARRGAKTRLAELGLNRSDLAAANGLQSQCGTGPPPWRDDGPLAGNVVSFRRYMQGATNRHRPPRV
jgi:hypothetical protein